MESKFGVSLLILDERDRLPHMGSSANAYGGGGRLANCQLFAYRRECLSDPHELSVSEIDELIETFVKSVKRCERLGIDLIELHFAHGYLFNQFLSPLTNLRTDRYGGDS